jgi:hypothetical protein
MMASEREPRVASLHGEKQYDAHNNDEYPATVPAMASCPCSCRDHSATKAGEQALTGEFRRDESYDGHGQQRCPKPKPLLTLGFRLAHFPLRMLDQTATVTESIPHG